MDIKQLIDLWATKKQKVLFKQGLESFIYLYLLYNKENKMIHKMFSFMRDEYIQDTIIENLKYNLFIVEEDNGEFILTDKANELFEIIETSFEDFWEHYHRITDKPKTDKEPAKKHWKKLTTIERTRALDVNIITAYATNTDIRYRKKARTYLADKNFNDEYAITESWTKMK